jgi:hypothetical protein
VTDILAQGQVAGEDRGSNDEAERSCQADLQMGDAALDQGDGTENGGGMKQQRRPRPAASRPADAPKRRRE